MHAAGLTGTAVKDLHQTIGFGWRAGGQRSVYLALRWLQSNPSGSGPTRRDAEGPERGTLESPADWQAGGGLKLAQRGVSLGAEPAIEGAGSNA